MYLRTGKLLPITDKLGAEPAIVVGSKGQAVVKALPESGLNGPIQGLAVESYLTATTDSGPEVVLVVGGDPIGTLYGAYRLAEHLGVRFYMHGDVVPDEPMALAMPPARRDGQAAVRPPRHPAVPRFSRRAGLVERRRLQGRSSASCPRCG